MTARSTKVQQAWIDAQVPQCGYCQSGQIMAAIALIERTGTPSDAQIDEAMTNYLPLRHLSAGFRAAISRCNRHRRCGRAGRGMMADNPNPNMEEIKTDPALETPVKKKGVKRRIFLVGSALLVGGGAFGLYWSDSSARARAKALTTGKGGSTISSPG